MSQYFHPIKNVYCRGVYTRAGETFTWPSDAGKPPQGSIPVEAPVKPPVPAVGSMSMKDTTKAKKTSEV